MAPVGFDDAGPLLCMEVWVNSGISIAGARLVDLWNSTIPLVPATRIVLFKVRFRRGRWRLFCGASDNQQKEQQGEDKRGKVHAEKLYNSDHRLEKKARPGLDS